MTQLLVTGIPESLVEQLERQAVKNGVSAEAEALKILKAAFPGFSAGKTSRTLFDAIRELGEIAPDFGFEFDRTPQAPASDPGKKTPIPSQNAAALDEAEAFKAHLLSEEYVVDDFPLPPRAKWPARNLGF